MSASSSFLSILDIPDEILLEILLLLNARERAVLGHFSDRFNRLVFEDKKLLRDLNFSNEGRLVSASDIRRYFEDEDTNKHILKINVMNVNCIETERMLNDYIGKALNLVDINIHGIELEDILQLSFLKPLAHVKKLSFDWPLEDDVEWDDTFQVIGEPFGKLIYLSVKINDAIYESFFYILAVCQELRKLRVISVKGGSTVKDWGGMGWNSKKLESIEYCGYTTTEIETMVSCSLPDNWQWKEIDPAVSLGGMCFYYVKDIEFSEELTEIGCLEDQPHWKESGVGSHVRPEKLLKMVIRITQEKVPEKFCSQMAEREDGERCALKIEDAMLLLKNPRHQIQYLYLQDSIGTKCEVHLFSLASPSLTELYLYGMASIQTSSSEKTNSQEENNFVDGSIPDRSFEMLVENTPLVRDLTLNGRSRWRRNDQTWDLDPLYLIQGWKNLRSLRLLSIPISDGKFLIEIGQRCKLLKKLEFYNLGPSHACCYIEDLLLMLSHCQNLTDFSMRADNIGQVSKLLVSLAKSAQLRRVRLTSFGEMNNATNLIPSVEQLLRRCSKLITLVCIIDGISKADSDQLTSALRRLRVELDRPSLQFQVVLNTDLNVSSKVDEVYEDLLLPSFPYTWEDCTYLERSHLPSPGHIDSIAF